MNPVYAAYLDCLEDLHRQIHEAIDDLPVEALDWSPGPEMNSLAVLVVHLGAAERYWIGDVALQDPAGRDRPAEFRAQGLGAADLGQRLDDSLHYARQALEKLPLEALGEQRYSPVSGSTCSAAWAVLHALEHTATHLGHIQVLRQLWDGRQ